MKSSGTLNEPLYVCLTQCSSHLIKMARVISITSGVELTGCSIYSVMKTVVFFSEEVLISLNFPVSILYLHESLK